MRHLPYRLDEEEGGAHAMTVTRTVDVTQFPWGRIRFALLGLGLVAILLPCHGQAQALKSIERIESAYCGPEAVYTVVNLVGADVRLKDILQASNVGDPGRSSMRELQEVLMKQGLYTIPAA